MGHIKKRYIFFTIIVIFSLPGILINLFAGNYFSLNIIILLALIYVLYLIKKVENSTAGKTELTQNEKIQVIITEMLNPLVAGAFYYYCWKNRFPKKASQANIYSWAIVGAEFVIALVLNQLGIIKLF